MLKCLRHSCRHLGKTHGGAVLPACPSYWKPPKLTIQHKAFVLCERQACRSLHWSLQYSSFLCLHFFQKRWARRRLLAFPHFFFHRRIRDNCWSTPIPLRSTVKDRRRSDRLFCVVPIGLAVHRVSMYFFWTKKISFSALRIPLNGAMRLTKNLLQRTQDSTQWSHALN